MSAGTPGRGLGALAAAGALLAAGCVALLNLAAARLYLRLDLSEGRLYSLSAASKRVLKALGEPIEIRVYASKELPPEYGAQRGYVRDLLEEYRQASGGNIRARAVEVGADDESKREAIEQGVAPIEFNVVTREKYEVRQGFLGVVLQHADKKEVLPVVVRTEGLEYDLTTRILQLTRARKKVLGMVSSHGAIGPEGLHARVRELLERNYELRPVDLQGLAPGATIAAEVSGLLVLGPTEALDPHQLYALDQFLLSDRPVVAAVETRKADLRQFMASPVNTGLERWLGHHGVGVRSGLVLDAQSQKVQVSQQRGWLTFTNIIDYPLFVNATDLDDEHPVTRHMDSLTMPLVSALEVSTAALGGRARVLARSSPYSWTRAAWSRGAFHSISPLQRVDFDEKEDARGPFALAASVGGPFSTYYSAEPGSERPPPKEAARAAHRARSGDSARLLAVGTARFASPEMPAGESGAYFLLNLADWLALDSDLIAIRSKGVALRPLREIPAVSKAALRWVNIVGPGLLLSAFGFVRARLRRRRSRRRVAELV